MRQRRKRRSWRDACEAIGMDGADRPSIADPAPPVVGDQRREIDSIAQAHTGDLRRFLAAREVDPWEREEIVQESFLRLAAYPSVAALENPRAFLFRVAENLMRDRRRRARARRQDRHEPIDDHDLTDPGPEPDVVVQHREALARTRAAILALDEPMRTAFVMSRYREMSYAEIAAAMKISVKTVEKYVSAALAQLRRAVGSDRSGASLRGEDRS
ncbi:RNA polymerase subunit sigma-24 [Caulobacter radicis]|nr:RNA polymerase subunit sigma-24 [Caulobacter radicis]